MSPGRTFEHLVGLGGLEPPTSPLSGVLADRVRRELLPKHCSRSAIRYNGLGSCYLECVAVSYVDACCQNNRAQRRRFGNPTSRRRELGLISEARPQRASLESIGQERRPESQPVEFLDGALPKIGGQVRGKKNLSALP